MEVGERNATLIAGKVCKISFDNDHTCSNTYKVIHTHTMVQQFSSLAPMVTLSANTWV